MKQVRQRSHAPIFWLLFGGGGMFAALVGVALVFITGIAAPLGIILSPDTMSYAKMLAFAQNFFGKGFIFVVIFLFLWHAAHRIYCTLHEVGLPTGIISKLLCYGSAFVGSVIAGLLLLVIWF